MTNPILGLNDVPQIQTTATELSPVQPEMSREEFGTQVFGLLEEGYKNNYDPDHTTKRIQEFALAHEPTAKAIGFSTEHYDIKTKVVFPYNTLRSKADEIKTANDKIVSGIKKGWDAYLDHAQATQECLAENVETFIEEGAECAATAATAVTGNGSKVAGIISTVSQCWDVMEPFIKCHVNPKAN